VTYVSLMSSFLSVWLTLAAALDRVTVMQRSSRQRTSLGSRTRARFVCVGLLWFALPVYLNVSILIDVVVAPFGPVCLEIAEYYDIMQVCCMSPSYIVFPDDDLR